MISAFFCRAPLHSPLSRSFRDFLLEEKKPVPGHGSGDHVKKVCFKGTENSPALNVARCSTHGTPGLESNHVSDFPLLDSPNPWQSSSLAASPAVAPVTFASIVEEERQQEAALIRSREKPLALIQVNGILALLALRTVVHFNSRSLRFVVTWFLKHCLTL